MNATHLLTVSFLRVYFQGDTTHWGIQCVIFDAEVDRRVSVSFSQTYPLPRAICVSSHRRCYASDGTRSIVSRTITVNDRRIPLKKWPSVDRIPGDGRWPFCFDGGGDRYGGANVTATCGSHGKCLDACFLDDDTTPPTVVWCGNSTNQFPVRWDHGSRGVGWKPWKNGHPRNEDVDAIELDSPLVINHASGVSAIARHGSQWVVRRDDGVCLAPMQWSDGACHVLVHGVCYLYDREASVHCVNLMPFPPGSMVALTWQPRLTRSSVQPFEPKTVHLFCLDLSNHDPQRFLICMEKFYLLAREEMSRLSPFRLVGRPSTVLIRVAPVSTHHRKRQLGIVQWGSIVVSVSLGIAIWGVITVTASNVSSSLKVFETYITQLTDALELSY